MKCEQVRDVLDRLDNAEDSLSQRFAYEHLRGCAACRDAVHAVHVLKAEATRLVPGPRDGAFERALFAAARAPRPGRAPRVGFWSGMALGGSLAAGLAIALLFLASPRDVPAPGSATPVVRIAPSGVRDINISLDAPEALEDAGIRVVLSGAIALRGYEGRRELRWSTRLDRGTNQLTLPVVALGAEGGQLLVEVLSGGKRRTFLVDVRSDASI